MTLTQYEPIEDDESDVSDDPEALLGCTIRDPYGREWVVTEIDSKDGESTVCGKRYWCYAGEATVIDEEDDQ